MPMCGKPGMRMSTACTWVPSSRCSALHTQSMLHQSRTPQEWSRWPGTASKAWLLPSTVTVPVTAQGIS